MRKLTHPAMLALGAAVLCLSCHIAPFISPLHPIVFHVAGSPYSVFLPVLINLCALWLVLALLLCWVRNPGQLHTLVWTGMMVLLPLVLIVNWFAQTAERVPHWLHVVIGLSPLLVLLLFLVARRPSCTLWFQEVQSFTAVVLGFVSLSALLVLAQFLWRFSEARGGDRRAPPHVQTRPITPHRSRVIWIIFDELSYQQVYERRFPGLQLPGFDLLAHQSVLFTHAVPTASYTDIAIPSLMTGTPADGVRFSGDGQTLALHDPFDGGWRTLDPHNTVFQDALGAGFKTAVDGWWNPYCRILPHVLDDCFWSSYAPVREGIFSSQPVWWNTMQIPIYYFEFAYSWLYASDRGSSSERNTARFHQLDYNEIAADADRLLNDPTMDFVFLHIPVPHGPSIYDRRSSSFTDKPLSYVDNLALADKCLTHLRLMLEKRHEWDSSTLVLMGDHSWRTQGTKQRTPDWRDENVIASHNGDFDDRPAYIVKFPYQQSPARIDAVFPALRTRALLDGIIDGRLKTAEDLAAWAAQQP